VRKIGELKSGINGSTATIIGITKDDEQRQREKGFDIMTLANQLA
jgi:sRNA-binding protein